MKDQLETAVKKTIDWFLHSGIMRPNDGFWGVAERIADIGSNEAKKKIDQFFPQQTRIDANTVVLEHRRADCTFETALMFDLAAEYFKDNSYREVAENLVTFLLNRSGMRVVDPDSKVWNLWRWSMQNSEAGNKIWTDDNAWVVIFSLVLARRSHGILRETGLSTARALHHQLLPYFDFIEKNGRDAKYEEATTDGIQLNPHWIGLATLALAFADHAQGPRNYYNIVNKYYGTVLDGPQAWDTDSQCKTDSGVDWAISEYAYLTFITPLVAKVYGDPRIMETAEKAAHVLLENQQPDGHFTSNHFEAPEGDHFVDLIYTQNWATLGFLHMAELLPGKPEYRAAFEKSARLLIDIQDSESNPVFKGCWRGMYDCQTGGWGGGNKFEGGHGSIYSGWTNAPISTAFLLELTGSTLLDTQLIELKPVISS